MFINVDLETSLKRNEERYRTVDKKFLRDTWEQIDKMALTGKYDKIFGKYFKEVDAMIDLGDPTKPRVEVELKQLRKVGNSFITAPLRNSVGKDIIKTLKLTKGKYYQDAFPDKVTLRKLEQEWIKVAWGEKK